MKLSGTSAGFPDVPGGAPALRRRAGFTLVELVVVLILLAILAAIAMARFDRDGFVNAGYADQLASMLRYGQKLAIAQHRPVYAQVEANRVSLCYAAAMPCANPVLAPVGANNPSPATKAQCGTGSWYCLGRPADVSYTATGSNPFAFDALGKPLNAAGGAFGGFDLAVKSGNSKALHIVVTSETGYVVRD